MNPWWNPLWLVRASEIFYTWLIVFLVLYIVFKVFRIRERFDG